VGTGTEPSDTADGKFQFAHWLGDSLTTRDIFSVEAKDQWVLVAHEHRTALGGAAAGKASDTAMAADEVYPTACTVPTCKL